MTICIQVMSESTLFREGMRCILGHSHQIELVAEATCKDNCFRYCNSDEVDVLIIDLGDGIYSNLECLHQIVVRHPIAKVLVIIRDNQRTLVKAILKYGAKGVVTHNTSNLQLVDAVTKVHQGGIYIEAMLAQAIAESTLDEDSPFEKLTSREKSILRILLNGKNNAEVATMLNISQKTVANHYSRIKKKLGVQNRVELTRLSIRHDVIKP